MEIKTGLWKKQSKKGNTYYSGKIEIEGKTYWIKVLKNNKETDKQPDLNMFLDQVVEEKKEEPKSSTSDEIFKAFGEGVDIDESELAF